MGVSCPTSRVGSTLRKSRGNILGHWVRAGEPKTESELYRLALTLHIPRYPPSLRNVNEPKHAAQPSVMGTRVITPISHMGKPSHTEIK